LNTFRGHQQEKYHVESVFSADESFVVSGSEDSKIYMWDLVSGKIVSSLSSHTGPVVSLSMHPKKTSVLLSASADGTIKLWN
jgi:WD40 repeat protein